MKRTLITIAGLTLAGAAIAQVDPTLPMVTGRGNVTAKPVKVIVTNQSNASTDQAQQLEKFVITGSLIQKPAKVEKSK